MKLQREDYGKLSTGVDSKYVCVSDKLVWYRRMETIQVYRCLRRLSYRETIEMEKEEGEEFDQGPNVDLFILTGWSIAPGK